jgi:hypothetical protein
MNALPIAAERTPAKETHISVWQSFQSLIFQPRPASLVYAFSIGILVSFIVWNVGVLPEGGSVEPALVGTMAPTGSPVIYENNISEDARLGTIYVTSRNGLVRVEIRWTGGQSATASVNYDPTIMYATGVESVMGESTLQTMSRSGASLEYVTGNSSIDITTLVLVDGAENPGVPVVEVLISSDELEQTRHRIAVPGSK